MENLNKVVTLPKGFKAGMATFKKSVQVTICYCEKNEENEMIYRAFWIDAKTYRMRYIWFTQTTLNQLTN